MTEMIITADRDSKFIEINQIFGSKVDSIIMPVDEFLELVVDLFIRNTNHFKEYRKEVN